MAETTTDHETIKQWAHRHKGKPAAVKSTHKGDDAGIIRIMFPKSKHSEHEDLSKSLGKSSSGNSMSASSR
jgi:hypothetical protein